MKRRKEVEIVFDALKIAGYLNLEEPNASEARLVIRKALKEIKKQKFEANRAAKQIYLSKRRRLQKSIEGSK